MNEIRSGFLCPLLTISRWSCIHRFATNDKWNKITCPSGSTWSWYLIQWRSEALPIDQGQILSVVMSRISLFLIFCKLLLSLTYFLKERDAGLPLCYILHDWITFFRSNRNQTCSVLNVWHFQGVFCATGYFHLDICLPINFWRKMRLSQKWIAAILLPANGFQAGRL